jgi:GT2 family glycosyltransferase
MAWILSGVAPDGPGRLMTIDLLKTTDASRHVRELSQERRSGCTWRILVATRKAGVQGWHRIKIVSPDLSLQRVSIEALDGGERRIGAFEMVTPGNRFTAYAFLGLPVDSLRIRLDTVSLSGVSPIATLRRIPLIEYIWRSLRRGSARRPLVSLRYFFDPPDPFIITLGFPQPRQNALYQQWIAKREGPAYKRLLKSMSVSIAERPSIAVLMTVCDPRPIVIRKAIDSVRRQTSDNWQLCIADDASTNPEVIQVLANAAQSDKRIQLRMRGRRGGISAASNTAFELVSSPFVARLDQDGTLARSAVDTLSRYLSHRTQMRLAYSDEDKIGQSGERFEPFFKPDFSRELLYSSNYLNHLTAYDSETIRRIGGWRSEFDGAQDYDLNLRIIEVVDEKQIGHVPMILYHQRAVPGSASDGHAVEAGRLAISEHLARRCVSAQVHLVADIMYRVRYELANPQPMVSIIIPFRDKADLLQQCVSSIREKTSYRNYELVLVDNGSIEPSTLSLLQSYQEDRRVRILPQPGVFNYSALNNRGVEYSHGDYLCLLNNDTIVITPDWLEDMVGYASQPGVGCVGAKLYYPSGTIQHAGVVLGLGGLADHAFRNRAGDDPGYFGRLQVASNYSAVTGACLVVSRAVYLEAGGLDERDLQVAFNDVDFCIKVRSRGYRNVMTPFAELFHHESSSRGPDQSLRFTREVQVMKQRYGALLDSDPCYSPHLTRTKDDFSLHAD